MVKIRRFVDTPVLLLALGLLAFGAQALWLGYYLDDWVFLYHIFRGGYERLAAYSFGVNRPFGAWPWWLGFSLLGYSPFKWQLWSLAWRILTVIFLWMGWKRVFPEKKIDLSLAAALFLVYPIFLQQTAAVTFSDHWMCFALYALSILLMVLAVQKPRLLVPLTVLALAASGLQLFTIEYFVGLELSRPLLLWFLFRDIPRVKDRLKKVLIYELPYALLLGAFLTWRFFFMATPGFDRNRPELLTNLLHQPLQTITTFSASAIRDLVEGLAGAWYKTYNPATITPAPIANLLSWGVAAAAFAITVLFFFWQAKGETAPDASETKTGAWLLASFVMLIAGFLPAWVIGEHLVSSGNYADRFGLAAMFGASLFLSGLASMLLKQNHKIIMLCLLIALGTGYQFRLANEYRWRWENQSRLAWQLSWRMPGLLPGTSVYGDGALASGSWADIAWLNFLYGSSGGRTAEDTWYYDANKIKADAVPALAQPLSEKRFELLSFEGNTTNSLVIQFKTVENQCLWVVTNEDQANPYLNPVIKQSLPLSNLSRISSTVATNPALPAIFLPEPVHSWCYYFEKASLAVQEKRWAEVKALWQELSTEKLKTGVAEEYLPFIYGTARAGDFDTALAISARAKSIDIKMQDPLCQTWKKVLDDPAMPGDTAKFKLEVVEKLECGYLIQ